MSQQPWLPFVVACAVALAPSPVPGQYCGGQASAYGCHPGGHVTIVQPYTECIGRSFITVGTPLSPPVGFSGPLYCPGLCVLWCSPVACLALPPHGGAPERLAGFEIPASAPIGTRICFQWLCQASCIAFQGWAEVIVCGPGSPP